MSEASDIRFIVDVHLPPDLVLLVSDPPPAPDVPPWGRLDADPLGDFLAGIRLIKGDAGRFDPPVEFPPATHG